MLDVRRFANETEPSPINSKRYRRVTDELEYLGVLLVGEVNEREYDDLVNTIATEVWDGIRNSLFAWAERTHESHNARNEAAARERAAERQVAA